MSTLKPCPFCGSEAEIRQWHTGDWNVCCVSKFCCGSTIEFANKNLAIEVWNKRYCPTPPLEAQQGEEGYTWRLCGKEDKVLSNVITATTKAIAEHPELFGYSRPSQSASREIKEVKNAIACFASLIWKAECNITLADREYYSKQLKIIRESSQSVGMVPISRIDVKLTVEEVLNNRFIGYSRGDHHPTLKGFLPDIVNEVTHAICAKFAQPDVKPLVEALEVSLESMQGCDDRQHIKRHDSAIHHAEVALFKYKPNAGRQG